MYEYQGLSDALFMALYGAVAMMALLGGLNLMFARGNVVAEKVAPPKSLRHWAVAFLAVVVASHVWWFVLGTVWLSADRVVRDTVCIALDLSTLVPLMMAVLLRLLQDRRRLLWPWFAAQLPVVAMAVWGIAKGDMSYATGGNGRPGWMVIYQMAIILLFLSSYVHALRQYGRWLRDNYADLEHKEVWKSLVVILVIVAVYCLYTLTAALCSVNTSRSSILCSSSPSWCGGSRHSVASPPKALPPIPFPMARGVLQAVPTR